MILSLRLVLVAAACCISSAHAFDIADFTRHIAPEVGAPLDATPGQRFYTDTWLKYGSAYEVAKPFESKMPGGGGFKFWFAIDSKTLTLQRSDANTGLKFYVPSDGRFRAWHALIGNVLAPGDTVGLVVDRNGGMSWFVDNTIKNNVGYRTLWSRAIDQKKDPALTRFRTTDAEPCGAPIRQLDYLGVRGGNVAIRFTELSRGLPPRTDEFFFPIGPDGIATGVVLGAEFQIRINPNQRAQIVVTSAMTDDYADKLDALPDDAPPTLEKSGQTTT